jgi:protein PhnA
METEPKCPKCNSENVYPDGNLWVCPECSHEWTLNAATVKAMDANLVVDDDLIRDSNGTVLNDGDDVTLIKELKVKGSTATLKVGTKAKNIRLIDAGDGHDISCRMDGIGMINLKSQFVRKM